jgi:hypothetical protein
MVSLRWHEVRGAPVEWSGRAMTLVGAQVVASLVTPWFGAAASYRFPRRAEIEGDVDAAVPLRDHVIVARIAGVTAVAAATLLGRIGR